MTIPTVRAPDDLRLRPPDQDVVGNAVSRAAGLFAIAAGALVLAGWEWQVPSLESFGHTITMKPNTAIALLSCGASLVAIGRGAVRRRLALAAAVIAGLIGALTLSEHLAGWDFGIDELLFQEPPGAAATSSPGRMGPNASLSMTLAAVAFVCLTLRSRRATLFAQIIGFIVASLALLAIVGYAYGAQELYSLARYTGIGWHTAVTLLVVAFGILAARPHVGPVATIVSDGPGGIAARRLLLLAAVVPLALGYAHLQGERAGLYDGALGTAIFTISVVLLFSVAIWHTAVTLDETDRARQAALRERDDLLVRERAARGEAERLSRSKDEFLATVSHELRTPLNTLLGWTHMLRTGTVTDERRAHAADVIARNAEVLARLVDDLLDVSRIATNRLPLNPVKVDLGPLVNAAVDAVAQQAKINSVRIVSTSDGLPTIVKGDPARLQQIVGNLLANAIKFTPAGGRVEVTLDTVASTARLTVRDTGRGIDPEFIPHVFERFRQGDATATREHGGLGLGLSIVRDLAEMHGGAVEAFSAGAGHGATFTVTFPLADLGQVQAAV